MPPNTHRNKSKHASIPLKPRYQHAMHQNTARAQTTHAMPTFKHPPDTSWCRAPRRCTHSLAHLLSFRKPFVGVGFDHFNERRRRLGPLPVCNKMPLKVASFLDIDKVCQLQAGICAHTMQGFACARERLCFIRVRVRLREGGMPTTRTRKPGTRYVPCFVWPRLPRTTHRPTESARFTCTICFPLSLILCAQHAPTRTNLSIYML